MKHLKLFDNAASYEVWKNGEDYVTPSVSYVEENDTIFYEDGGEFTEDELLYYCVGTDIECEISLKTLKVKKSLYGEPFVEENANKDEQGNIVVNVNGRVPGYWGAEAMYWTSTSVNSIPMNFEYTLYDESLRPVFSGEFNEMVTLLDDNKPLQRINLYQSDSFNQWPILEIKSKISNKTHRIKFE